MDIYVRWSLVLYLKMVHTTLNVPDDHAKICTHGFSFGRRHYHIAETCYLNKKRLLYFMYTYLFLLSQVQINTKERINLQTETNRHFFGHYLQSCHSSCMLMLAGQQPTRNVTQKLSSFSKRRQSAIWHLQSSRLAHCVMLWGHSKV